MLCSWQFLVLKLSESILGHFLCGTLFLWFWHLWPRAWEKKIKNLDLKWESENVFNLHLLASLPTQTVLSWTGPHMCHWDSWSPLIICLETCGSRWHSQDCQIDKTFQSEFSCLFIWCTLLRYFNCLSGAHYWVLLFIRIQKGHMCWRALFRKSVRDFLDCPARGWEEALHGHQSTPSPLWKTLVWS